MVSRSHSGKNAPAATEGLLQVTGLCTSTIAANIQTTWMKSMGYTAYYDRCAYEEDCGVEKAKHSYRLQMSIPVSPRKFCQCQSHLTLSQQNLKSLGKYPPSLTREIATEVGRYFGRKTITFSR